MTSVRELVDRTLHRYLRGTYVTRFGQLQSTITPASLDVQLTGVPQQVGQGNIIAMGDELAQVLDVNNTTLSLIRGIHGTVSVGHVANTLVEISPRFARFNVRDALRETVDSWPDWLYWTEQIETSLASGESSIRIDQLATDDAGTIIGAVRVYRLRGAGRWDHESMWRLDPDVDDVGSWRLTIDEARSTTYRVVLARRFRTDGWDDELDLNSIHFPSGLEDAACLGAASRLLLGKETLRLDNVSQGESRMATEVRAADTSRFALNLLALHDRQIERYAETLANRWGVSQVTFG